MFFKKTDLILLVFREDTIQRAIDLFYPAFISNRKESTNLIFVENAVESQCKLTKGQKNCFLDNVKQFGEYYIQIDCNTKYNMNTLKELIYSFLFDSDNDTDNLRVMLRKQKKKIRKKNCL